MRPTIRMMPDDDPDLQAAGMPSGLTVGGGGAPPPHIRGQVADPRAWRAAATWSGGRRGCRHARAPERRGRLRRGTDGPGGRRRSRGVRTPETEPRVAEAATRQALRAARPRAAHSRAPALAPRRPIPTSVPVRPTRSRRPSRSHPRPMPRPDQIVRPAPSRFGDPVGRGRASSVDTRQARTATMRARVSTRHTEC